MSILDEMRNGFAFIHGDAWELQSQVPDESVDLVLTDPPYMRMHTRSAIERQKRLVGVFKQGDFRRMAEMLWRVMKDGTNAFVFTQEYTPFFLTVSALQSVGFRIMPSIVWVKASHSTGNYQTCFSRCWELIVHAQKGRAVLRGTASMNLLLEYRQVSNRIMIHPTQKPVDLCAYLIGKGCDEGAIVFDPFAGVATTLVAAARSRRRGIGFELVEEYYRKGKFLLDMAIGGT